MKTVIKDIKNSQKEILFEIPYESFLKSSDEELEKVIPGAKIPGFRPGKAPKDIIRKNYSHKIKSNAIERLISESMSETFITNSINPLSQPIISDMVFEDGKPITFTAKLDVFPKLALDKISDFSIDKFFAKISDKDVNNMLEEIRSRQISYIPVEGRDTAKQEDMVIIDFLGKVDGEAFQGGESKNFSLTLGSSQFIPGFEDQVVGMKQGEVKDITVKFPDNYQESSLAGKDAVFTVTLHEIKQKSLPELDDEFAKDIDHKCNTVEDLKGRIRKALEAEFVSKSKNDTFIKLLVKIVEENDFEVPYSFVREHAERLAYNSMSQFYSMGLDPEKMGINFESIIERHIVQAKDQVKHALIINEISLKNSISVEEADIDNYFDHHADLQERPATDIKKEIESSNQLEAVKNDLLGDKVYEYLCTINKIKEKIVTREEYEKIKEDITPSTTNEKQSTLTTKKAKSVKEDSKEENEAKSDKTKKIKKEKKEINKED